MVKEIQCKPLFFLILPLFFVISINAFSQITITTTQNTQAVFNRSAYQQVIGIEIATPAAVAVTQINFSTNGTANIADITNARVWYTGTSNTFATLNQFGTTVTPIASFSITGSRTLSPGTNYFWLTFDVSSSATPCNVIDAECTAILIGGTSYTPTVISPAGNRNIIPNTITSQWDKVYGGSVNDQYNQAAPFLITNDGGYMLGGSSRSGISGDKTEPPRGQNDYWMVKTDDIGNKLWDKTYGGNGLLGDQEGERLSSLIQLRDHKYLLGGTSTSGISGDKTQNFTGGDREMWVVKTDENGNKIWDRRFGGTIDDGLQRLIEDTINGGYLLAGGSTSNISGNKTENSRGNWDYWIVKIDTAGNQLWDKTFGGNGWDPPANAIQTHDGGYLLIGTSFSGISGDKTAASYGGGDGWIVKTHANGNFHWDKAYGGSGDESFSTVIPTMDGNYLLAGHTRSPVSGTVSQPSQGNLDYWIVKIDPSGNRIWDRKYGGTGDDVMITIIQTPDQGYLLGGYSNSPVSGNKTENSKGGQDFWILKVDSNGNDIWDKTFGGSLNDVLVSLSPANNNQFLLTGYSSSGVSGDKTQPSKGGIDYWMILTDTVPSPLTAFITHTLASCNGNDGAATVIVSGGYGNYTYSWNNGATTSSITGLTPGTYTVTITDACSTLIDSILINEPEAMVALDSVKHAKCAGGNEGAIYTSGGTPGYNYNWSNGATTEDIDSLTAGNYTCTITDTSGCTKFISVTIDEPNELNLTFSGDTIICKGETTTINATILGGTPPYTLTWDPGTITGPSVSISPSSTTIYTVIVTDSSNCPFSPQSVTISVHPSPDATITPEGPFCIIHSIVQLNARDTGGYWSGIGITDPALGIFDPSTGIGMYTIIYNISVAGCSDVDSIEIEVKNSEADFDYKKISCNNQIQFINLSSSTSSNHWDFGDGATSNETNPLHVYQANEKYMVTLITDPGSACADTASATIPFENDTLNDSLFTPNVFTPNGDGKNDYFEIIQADNSCIQISRLTIFNRWGKKVFEAAGSQFKWDGTKNGNLLANGAYFYIIEGEGVKKSGNVTLLR